MDAFKTVVVIQVLVCVLGVTSQFWNGRPYDIRYLGQYERADNLQSCTNNRLQKAFINQTGYFQYMQFLPTYMPDLTAFTYCYWLRPINVTHGHTVLSYATRRDPNEIVHFIYPEDNRFVFYLLFSNFTVFTTSAPIPFGWFHSCVTWDASDGRWDIFMDGKRLDTGYNKQFVGRVIPGGGILIAGQDQDTYDGGFDRTQGVEGDMTLITMDSRPMRPGRQGENLANFLFNDCSPVDRGNIVSWVKTHIKYYGGVHVGNIRQECRNFE